jgi:hypothetical protein
MFLWSYGRHAWIFDELDAKRSSSLMEEKAADKLDIKKILILLDIQEKNIHKRHHDLLRCMIWLCGVNIGFLVFAMATLKIFH